MDTNAAEQIALQQKTMVAILNIAMNTLNARLLTLLGIVVNTAIFSWAMYVPQWERIVTAALFSVAIWCLLRVKPQEKQE
jgi:hypothetical protein